MSEPKKPVARQYDLSHLTAGQLGYIAGIIDGEGCVTISRKRDTNGTKGGICYRPYIGVSNTKIELLAWIVDTVGFGHVTKCSRPKTGSKQAWRWEVWSQKAGSVVRAVRPYLVIKQQQADLILSYVANATRRPGRDGLTPEERRFQIDTYEKIRVLNKRGAL